MHLVCVMNFHPAIFKVGRGHDHVLQYFTRYHRSNWSSCHTHDETNLPSNMTEEPAIITLPVPPLPTLPSVAEPYDNHRSQHTPIIIDNGSTTLRWGFSTSPVPYTGANSVAKYKERRNNKPLLLFGEAIDCESGAKGQARTPWEGDVLLNFDALVCGFTARIRRKS